MTRIGIDCDGVLADFNNGFIDLIRQHTGKTLPPVSDVFPDVWAFHKPYVTPEQESAIWEQIKHSNFWLNLAPLRYAEMTLALLSAKRYAGDEVYFITSRPGVKAKLLTEYWLRNWGYGGATVLVVNNDAAKGLLANALRLDLFIDDKPENCKHVVEATQIKTRHVELDIVDTQVWYTYEYPCRVCLVDTPYNHDFHMPGVHRVTSAWDALNQSETKQRAA